MAVEQLVGGRYRLVERIGTGGMGTVWRAQDEKLNRRVAVKELHLDHGDERARSLQRARAVREALAAAGLDHQNIAAVHDVVDDGVRPWIVMQFVDGTSLKNRVAADGPLAPDVVARVGMRLADALAAAHDAGVIHRDVKPANIVLGAGTVDDPRVWLVDFGIALLSNGVTLTGTGAMLGTPGYLAPEQARGERVGPSGDVFGLAASLYYAVEGVGPFEAATPWAALAEAVAGRPRKPERAEWLAPILLPALRPNPDARPTLSQLRQALAMGGAPKRRSLRRRQLVLGAFGAVVIAAGGAVARSTRTSTDGASSRAEPGIGQPSPAVPTAGGHSFTLLLDRGTLLLSDGRRIDLNGSLAGKVQEVHQTADGWLVGTYEERAAAALWLVFPDGSSRLLVGDAEGAPPVVSTDGRRFAWRAGGKILFGHRTGADRLTVDHTSPAPQRSRPLAIAADAVLLGDPATGGGVYIYDVWLPNRGPYVPTPATGVSAVYGPAPDGRSFLGMAGDCLVELDPGQQLRAVRRACGVVGLINRHGPVSPDGRWIAVDAAGDDGRPAIRLLDLGTVFTTPPGPSTTWDTPGPGVWLDSATMLALDHDGHPVLLRLGGNGGERVAIPGLPANARPTLVPILR